MKKCSYCAEEIQDDAIKCKHCGEFLVRKQQEKWYFRTSGLIIAFFCIGPLALPLLWLNPHFNRRIKIIVSIIVIIASYYLVIASLKSLKIIGDYYKLMFQQF